MKQPQWAKMEAKRLAYCGLRWSIIAGLLHLVVIFILASAWLGERPLGFIEAAIAAAGIVAEYRLWSRLPGLRRQIEHLKSEARAWNEAKAAERRGQ